MNQVTNASPGAKSGRRWHRWLVLSLGLLLVIMPWVLAKTSLRDRLLAVLIGGDDVEVSSRDASFGYFTPLSLTGLRIDSRDHSARVEIEQIAAEKSWLRLLWSRPDLGTFRFDQPTFDITVNLESLGSKQTESSPPAKQTEVKLPNLVAEIRDAAVVVRTGASSEPPIDINRISATIHLERANEHSYVRVDPLTIFDHQPLTPQICDQGLQLVAPLLADELSAEGEFSLRIDEFQVPLTADGATAEQTLRVAGQLELHRGSVALKNTVTSQVITMIAELVDEQFPDRLVIAEGVTVDFQVVNGRVHHEGLAFVLPHRDRSIEITSSGSVGLDESLDLQVAIQLPGGLLGRSQLGTILTGQPIVVAVAGTVDDPQLGLAGSGGWVQSIAGLIGGDEQDPSDDQLSDALMGVVGGLLDRATQRAGDRRGEQPLSDETLLEEPLFRRLRDRLRGRRERRQTPNEIPPADKTQPTPL